MRAPAQGADRRVAWTLGLGVAALLCLGPLTGVAALAVGSWVLLRPRGRRHPLAVVGMVAGALGTGSFAVLAWVVAQQLQRGEDPLAWLRDDAPAPTTAPLPASPPAEPTPPPEPPPTQPPTRAHHGPVESVQIAANDPRALHDILGEGLPFTQQLLVVRSARCAPCDAFERALDDPRMQAALGQRRVVIVDALAFEGDLTRLRLDARALPLFVRLDARGRADDAITGGEWDADTPGNMAPVLGRLLAGTLGARRYPAPFLGISL